MKTIYNLLVPIIPFKECFAFIKLKFESIPLYKYLTNLQPVLKKQTNRSNSNSKLLTSNTLNGFTISASSASNFSLQKCSCWICCWDWEFQCWPAKISHPRERALFTIRQFWNGSANWRMVNSILFYSLCPVHWTILARELFESIRGRWQAIWGLILMNFGGEWSKSNSHLRTNWGLDESLNVLICSKFAYQNKFFTSFFSIELFSLGDCGSKLLGDSCSFRCFNAAVLFPQLSRITRNYIIDWK